MKTLVIDIGNTDTVAGIYEEKNLLGRVRFRTLHNSTVDEYRAHMLGLFDYASDVKLSPMGADRAVICSVVPALEKTVTQALRKVPALFVKSDTRRKFELDLPIPEQLGADRLANVAGALEIVSGPFLVVDAGTATTFCLVDERPAYIGGAITPGLEISWKALQSRAAKLYSVELNRPKSPLGRTTESQIQSGVLLGYEALIEGMADRLLSEQAGKNYQLIATGGCIQLLKLSDRWRIEPDLTLKGLLAYGELTG
ncbi:type III pantothenate kinase [bacterium]|jgi:type III pantothenate kinase|nr:type III pantothenate kinase [bacterium]